MGELRRGMGTRTIRFSGWVSKVKAEGTASSSRESAATRRSRAPCPMCTPSKKPRAITRRVLSVVFKGYTS